MIDSPSELFKKKQAKRDKSRGTFGALVGGPYEDWNDTVSFITRRNKYTCQICGKEDHSTYHIGSQEIVVSNYLVVHHLDEDKGHDSPENLATLCISCHGKIHRNPRFKTQVSAKLQNRMLSKKNRRKER